MEFLYLCPMSVCKRIAKTPFYPKSDLELAMEYSVGFWNDRDFIMKLDRY